jgi:hypothetical protein
MWWWVKEDVHADGDGDVSLVIVHHQVMSRCSNCDGDGNVS